MAGVRNGRGRLQDAPGGGGGTRVSPEGVRPAHDPLALIGHGKAVGSGRCRRRSAPGRTVEVEWMKETAPTETVGCTIDSGQEAGTEILGKGW